ncbi:hypothetical protein GW17_00046782 [Ensete ventricosum]|nr:hypothetical protein GW17_00046782 [Ensete ventricosum]RZS20979.1 hypothetical protein BHM03_00053558 [Ensete ventricosum]
MRREAANSVQALCRGGHPRGSRTRPGLAARVVARGQGGHQHGQPPIGAATMGITHVGRLLTDIGSPVGVTPARPPARATTPTAGATTCGQRRPSATRSTAAIGATMTAHWKRVARA